MISLRGCATWSAPLLFAPPPLWKKQKQLPLHCSQHFLNNDLTSCAFRIPLDIKDWINIRWLSCIAVIVTDLLTEKTKKTKVVCLSCLLKCLRSLYGKQCGPRSDCSYRSSLFWVHTVCSILNSSVMLGNYLQQATSADDIFRCIFFLVLSGLKCYNDLLTLPGLLIP